MVAFGPVPNVAAHAERGNPLAPKTDRSVEVAHRGRAPPVPRAPRPAAKAQSAGALARDMWSRRPGSSSSGGSGARRASEQRRPREESPFQHATEHRRVASLNRELETPENQGFMMGAQRRSSSRTDFSRGHALGQDIAANVGMPWVSIDSTQDRAGDDGDAPRNVGRRSILKHERQAANQALEWVPDLAVEKRGDNNRVSTLRREDQEGAYEFLPGAARNSTAPATGDGGGYHGRRNVLHREMSSKQSLDMPRASGYIGEGGSVPTYGRVGHVIRENPVGFQRAAADILAQ